MRLPVRVKSVFSAPVPEYSSLMALAWSAHTEQHHCTRGERE